MMNEQDSIRKKVIEMEMEEKDKKNEEFQNEIIIPPVLETKREVIKSNNLFWQLSLSLFILFLFFVVILTFLNLEFSVKILTLLLGWFLIFDIHRSIKANLYGSQRSGK